ncbi:MAG: ATP-binding protein [Candidatus Binatia bacterium]
MTPDQAHTPSDAGAADRREMDRLFLPDLRERIRASLTFLAIAQAIYAVALPFTQGPMLGTRSVINLVRLAVLFLCIRELRGEGTRRHTLTVNGAALATQLATGVLMSAIRLDVLPMVFLVTVVTCICSVLIPWGGKVQAVVAGFATAGLALATLHVYLVTGVQQLGFDAAVTIFSSLLVSVFIAFYFERSRTQLEERLEAGRRADEELATLRGQLERRVAERTAELEMANRELEGFSYTVSHDLRSPLRTIGGFSHMLLDEGGDSLDEVARSHLHKIRDASRRMDRLIDDMLLLARVGRGALRYEVVDLADMARTIGSELAVEYPERRVELTVEPVPAVRGDHALLRIAMDNLLRNAWKFTAAREVAHIRVRGENKAGNVTCRVSDDGIGFDPRFRGKLFQPFERIHDEPRFPGTGVGLATVARIAQRHGGSVEAEGELGQGATFSIVLPLQPLPPPA